MKLSIIIPVRNEERTIKKLLDTVIQTPLTIDKEIIVMENGSTDNTKNILTKYYKDMHNKENLTFIMQECKGKSEAVIKGIEYVTGDIVIIQDADLEYDPNDYQKLIQPILDKKAEVVYGSRRLNKSNKKYSALSFYLGGNILTLAANFLYTGIGITDESTCYKVFKSDIIKSLDLNSKRFEFCPEVTAKIYNKKIKIYEVPIKYYPRSKSEGKKICWKDGVEALWVLFKYSNIIKDGLKFITVGGIGSLIYLFVLWFLTDVVGLYYILSAIIGIGVAAIWNFIMYRMWAFKSK